MRDELNEKNKVIRNLQQRLNDLKKTLQRELKYQQLPNEAAVPNPAVDEIASRTKPSVAQIEAKSVNGTGPAKKVSLPTPIVSPTVTSAFLFNGIPSNKKLDDINHKYLKHVILKFLTSREYEVGFTHSNVAFEVIRGLCFLDLIGDSLGQSHFGSSQLHVRGGKSVAGEPRVEDVMVRNKAEAQQHILAEDIDNPSIHLRATIALTHIPILVYVCIS